MTDSPSDNALDNKPRTVNVTTGARLHFGLLRTSHPFGGLGVIIDAPPTSVSVISSETFVCFDETSGDHEALDRVIRIAQRFAAFHELTSLPQCRVTIRQRPPAHSGLGSGTQLALAVSQSLTKFFGMTTSEVKLSQEIAGRGERSAVGIHGFFHGGLVFENSMEDSTERVSSINPIASRHDVPTNWRAVIFRPRNWIATVSGDAEKEHFVRTQTHSQTSLARLITIAEQELLPAVADEKFDTFADAVQRFNRESGLLFESVQGGPYNGPVITDLVERLKSLGAVGIGQSSWGPSVFCWCESEASAKELLSRVPIKLADGFITCAKNSSHQVH